MQRFLTNFLLFVSIVVILVSGLLLLSESLIKSREDKFLKIGDDKSIVFSGDSNVECSVNDSLIRNSVNIAQSGEAYLYSFAKLQALLDHNKQIKTVLIGFSFHEILKDKEDLLLGDDSYVIEKIKNYNYLLNRSEKRLIMKINPAAYFKGVLQSVFNNFIVFARSYISDGSEKSVTSFGGYLYLVRDKLDEDIKIQSNSLNDSTARNIVAKGVLQEKYLKMISQLCHEKSVKLILLNTPKHKFYSKIINNEIRDNWISFRNSMPGDSLFEFSAFPLPDSCFSDVSHLNYRGARTFSLFLNGKLSEINDTSAAQPLN